MHSLEEIIRMNAPAEVAKRIRANRLFNSGCAGHAKGGEKTGAVRIATVSWTTDGEHEARKKKKRKRRGY